jgi:uncharacterized protein YcfL
VLFLLCFTRTNAQKEITVSVKEGSFLVKDIKLSNITKNGYYVSRVSLDGNVVNNTNKDWSVVYFQLYLYDEEGNKLKGILGDDSFTFQIYDFKRGKAKPIPSGMDFSGIPREKIAQLGIYFESGEYVTKYFFTMVKPIINNSLLFDDTAIKIQFSISQKKIQFVLKNKTENPITIDWNKVSYIDVSMESHRVMHTGVRYIERDKPQAPTIIPPTAKVEDEIIPVDKVFYGEYLDTWLVRPFFPLGPEALSYKGKSFSIFMPLEINGVVKNHLFTFTIQDVEY